MLLPAVLIAAVDFMFARSDTDGVATLVQQQLLMGAAKIISEPLAKIDGGYEISIPPAAFELFANKTQDRVFYSVRSKSGILLAGDADMPLYAGALEIEQEKYFLASMRGEPVRVIAYKHALPSTRSTDYAITEVAQTLHGHTAFRHDLMRTAVRETLILFVLLVSGLAFAVRWTLLPLIAFGAQLRDRRPGSLQKLDADTSLAELRPIIVALNDYVVRLDHTLGSYEQFVANTAHHLRTTFAILTSQINFGRRDPSANAACMEVFGAMQKSVAHGGRAINQLLVLATVEQKRPDAASVAVNLAATVTSVIEELAPLAQQKGIELGVDALDEQATVMCSAYLLRELIANLVDNAIQHLAGNGTVIASVLQAADATVLEITDSGPGIPEHQRARVFERFYRIDQTKAQSSGLGLAIVKEICDAIGAQVALCAGDHGAGLRVTVRFPIAGNHD
ncbi:sensor histidine kinase [Massilia sp. R2A-15]|uniref:sensor histidine kinase n=1 Tax=Massilia sp. R2A-15 TaxID=3064278 RepID=UPI0027331E07|nr:sensor histidine kinase [Massilia sp. R2A-15]WLI91160.1 sensor histidine kinase [Massilia sp. R2A-15]